MNNFHLLKMMCKWKKIKRLGVFFPEIIQSVTSSGSGSALAAAFFRVLRFPGAPRLWGRWSAWGVGGLQLVSGVPAATSSCSGTPSLVGFSLRASCFKQVSAFFGPSLNPPSGLGVSPNLELWGAAPSRSASIPAFRAAASISHLCYGKSRGGEAGERKKEGKKERKQRRTKLVCHRSQAGKRSAWGLSTGCLGQTGVLGPPCAFCSTGEQDPGTQLSDAKSTPIPARCSNQVSLNPAARNSTASTQNVY